MAEQTDGNVQTQQPQAPQAPQQPQAPAAPSGAELIFNQVKALGIEADKLPQVLQEYKQLKETNPYPNELVQKLAEGFKQGKSLQDMQGFLQAQMIDTQALSDEAAVKMKIRMENPGWTDRDVQFEFDDLFPSVDDEDDGGRRESKIRREALKAKQWLDDMKARADIPVQQQNQQAEQRRALLKNSWTPIVAQLGQAKNSLSFSYEGKEIGGAYSFDFNIPDAPIQNKQVDEAVLQYATDQGLDLTEENLQKLSRYREQLMWNIHREEFFKHMLIDMYSSMKEQLTKSRAKVMPPSPTTPPAQRKPPAKPKVGGKPGFV